MVTVKVIYSSGSMPPRHFGPFDNAEEARKVLSARGWSDTGSDWFPWFLRIRDGSRFLAEVCEEPQIHQVEDMPNSSWRFA